MTKTENNIFNTDNENGGFIEDYLPQEELSELETQVLAESVDRKLEKNRIKLQPGIIKHLIALRKYLFDKNVKWYRKSVVVAALIYFITPVDAIPDFVPFFGYLDDIGVIAWTINFLGKEIKNYY
ncbi:MAG: YkvA family protein [Ignavibacteria bacterium]|jgi:uncharacterized membrane protein YkvA (DUF1232 family)